MLSNAPIEYIKDSYGQISLTTKLTMARNPDFVFPPKFDIVQLTITCKIATVFITHYRGIKKMVLVVS